MSDSPTLPTGIPRLDEIVAKEAEMLASHRYEVRAGVVAALDPDREPARTWADLTPWRRGIDIATEAALLRDLTRPGSRDWAVRVGSDIEHYAKDPDTGPMWEEIRDRWLSMRDDPTAIAQALAAVCRDG